LLKTKIQECFASYRVSCQLFYFFGMMVSDCLGLENFFFLLLISDYSLLLLFAYMDIPDIELVFRCLDCRANKIHIEDRR
jgi:hypothetical protein